jgi:hypothetical protein
MTKAEFFERRIGELNRRSDEAARVYAETNRSALASFDEKRARIESERTELLKRRHDPIVLVNYWTWKWYHYAADPCGRVTGSNRDIQNFRELYLWEAEAMNKEPCSACGWKALRERERGEQPSAS